MNEKIELGGGGAGDQAKIGLRLRIALLSLLILVSGCSRFGLPQSLSGTDGAQKLLSPVWRAWQSGVAQLVAFLGVRGEAPSQQQASQGTAVVAQSASSSSQAVRMNAEYLQEIYSVVWMHPPQDAQEFSGWVNTLNQGASLEGVYHGMIQSKAYHQLELEAAGAPVLALKVFGQELAALERQLPEPSLFSHWPEVSAGVSDEQWRKGDFQDQGTSDHGGQGLRGEGVSDDGELTARWADFYSRNFVGISIYGLKRILGEEALKVMAHHNPYREKLATWYSVWAVGLATRQVDFGLPARRSTELSFHYHFALVSSLDRLQWEVLNRLHRLLNDAAKPR